MSRRFDFEISTNSSLSPLSPLSETTFEFGRDGLTPVTGSVGDGGLGDVVAFDYEFGVDVFSELSFEPPTLGEVGFDFVGGIDLEFPDAVVPDAPLTISGRRIAAAEQVTLEGRGASLGGVNFDVIIDHSDLSVSDFRLFDTVLGAVFETQSLIDIPANEIRMTLLDLRLDSGAEIEVGDFVNGVPGLDELSISLGGVEDTLSRESGNLTDTVLKADTNIASIGGDLLKVGADFLDPATATALRSLSGEFEFLKSDEQDQDFWELAYTLIGVPADIGLALTQSAELDIVDFDMRVTGEDGQVQTGSLSQGLNIAPVDSDGDGFFHLM